MSGAPIDDDAEPLYEAELALDGADLRRPTWTVSEISPGTRVTVGIVGAGMSGIIAAHRLRQAGVEVVVFEKNDDVGGTWLENDYPGCRVDIQNHFYSYATAQTPDWPQYHSPQPVLLDYFRTCIERFGVADCIRYSTEVLGARWDEAECAWFVDTSSEGGAPETHRLDALVCATGQLNRPSMPDIKGIDDFTGPSFHSARWDDTVDLRDKRVAVIGTGASAAQFIPRVADVAAELVVFQRTPPWLLPGAGLRRRRVGRAARPAAPRAAVRELGSPLDLRPHARGPVAAGDGRPRLGGRRHVGERGERDAADDARHVLRGRVPRPRAAGEDAAELPADREARRARRRPVPDRAPAATTSPSRRPRSTRSTPAASRRPTERSTTSTSSSTAPASKLPTSSRP